MIRRPPRSTLFPFLTAARRLLEGLRRIVVLSLGDARLTALERRRGDPEERADAGERRRLGERSGGLRGPRRHDRRGWERWQVGRPLGERELADTDQRLVERRLGERDGRGELGRRRDQRKRCRGPRGRRGEQRAQEERAERQPPDRPPSLPEPVFPSPAGGRPSRLFSG